MSTDPVEQATRQHENDAIDHERRLDAAWKAVPNDLGDGLIMEAVNELSGPDAGYLKTVFLAYMNIDKLGKGPIAYEILGRRMTEMVDHYRQQVAERMVEDGNS